MAIRKSITSHLRSSRWLLTAFMLIAIVALALPNTQEVDAVTAADFCSVCAQQCDDESDKVLIDCINNDEGDIYYCTNQRIDYYNNCVALFCNSAGCSVKKKPRIFPSGN